MRFKATILLPLAAVIIPQTSAKCPNDCSQHGLCSGPGTKAFCICEAGYINDDCSLRTCPKGDDPFTDGQEHRKITVSTSALDGSLGGHFDFTFMGQSVGFDAKASVTAMKYSMEALPGVASVEVSKGVTASQGGATYTITFLGWPTGNPVDNNLYSHDGNPPLSFFSCSTLSVTGAEQPACEVRDYGTAEDSQLVEHVACSRHGECNARSGACLCDRGWRGENCADNSDAEDLELMNAEGPFFSGAVARLRSFRAADSNNFDFLVAEGTGGSEPVLKLSGRGDLSLHKGSLNVAAGDVTLREGSLNVVSGHVDIGSGGATITAGSSSSSSSSLPSSSSSTAAARGPRGLEVKLASEPLDVDLAALGLGVAGSVVGVEFEHGTLLSVSAPATTMAALMDRGEGDDDDGNGGGGFDYLSVGPDGGEGGGGGGGGEGAAALQRQRRATSFLRVDHRGVTHFGGALGGGVVVEQGDLVVGGKAVVGAGGLEVAGGLVVSGPLGVGVEKGPLVVRDGNALVRSPSLTQPALSVTAFASSSSEDNGGGGGGGGGDASSSSFSSSVLDLAIAESDLTAGAGESGFFVRATRSGRSGGSNAAQSLFAVDGAGGLQCAGGVSVGSGGVHVASGGIAVGSGGITVEGGVKIASGALDLATPEGMVVSQGGLRAVSTTEARPALVAAAPSPSFRGAVARLEASGLAASSSGGLAGGGEQGAAAVQAAFNFLEARLDSSDEPLMAVDGGGKVFASGLETKGGSGDITAGGGLSVGGRVGLALPGGKGAATVSAGAGITIDPCSALTQSSYVRIASDGAAALNFLRLPVDGTAAASATGSSGSSSSPPGSCVPGEGQLLLIYNGDEEPTTGHAEIPSGRAVLFIFSLQAGPGWVPLTTLDARSTRLEKVTALTAANNLDVGAFALKAHQLVAGGQTKGQVALYGAGGLLTGDAQLTFDDKDGTLRTPKLNVKQVDSSEVDFMGSPLSNVRVESGSASGLSVVRTQSLFVESLNANAGQLLVAASGNGVAAASEVYVSKQATATQAAASNNEQLSNNEGVPKQAVTLTTPALRVSNLGPFSGSLGLVGVHGEVLARSDVGITVLADKAGNGQFAMGNAVSMSEAADLARRGKPTEAVLRVPRVATAVLVGATPVTTTTTAAAAAATDGGEAAAGVTTTTSVMKAEVRVEGDLLLGGNKLRGADIVESSLSGLDELGVTWLTVRAARGNTLAYFSENSTLQSLPGVVVAAGGRALAFEEVGIGKLTQDLDVGGHTLTNLKVTGGNLEGLKSIGADSLVIAETAPAVAAASAVAGGGQGPRKLFALLGPGGKVEASPSGLSFDAEQRVLHASTLGAHAWGGDVGGNGFSLTGAVVTGGSVEGVGEVSSEGGLSCKGDLDVGEDGSVGGTLVVGGTVMGSGPYVDSSDARLKTHVTDLFPSTQQHPTSATKQPKGGGGGGGGGVGNSNVTRSDEVGAKLKPGERKEGGTPGSSSALQLIQALRPVRYRFNQTLGELTSKRFPTGDEIGFIAQEVEAVLPEIVTTGADGFKGVAYSRLAPVLVGAAQEAADEAALLRAENDALKARVTSLEAKLLEIQAGSEAQAGQIAEAFETLSSRLLVLESR